jgi:hypothetical protein
MKQNKEKKMKAKKLKTLGGFFLLFFCLSIECQNKETLTELLKKGDLEAAETFCMKQSNKKQGDCFRQVGDACLEQKDFERAARYYEKSQYRGGFDRIAAHYFSEKNYRKAKEYYKKGTDKARLAQTFGCLGDYYRDNGDPSTAKEYYKTAVHEYEKLIKTFNYQWTLANDNDRKRCKRERDKFPKSEKEKSDQAKLTEILKKSAEYCRQLEQTCIYFFCHEEITEKVDYSRQKLKNIMATHSETRSTFYKGKRTKRTPQKMKRTYLYEYQLIREKPEDEAVESRILLKKNGKKKHKENAQLKTTYYKHEKVLFGPIGLLDHYWQRYYDYKILKEELLNGEKTVVIEAIPMYNRRQNTLFGKIWVKIDDFSIVKIEWYPNSVKNIRTINAIANAYGEVPKVTFVSEFNKERNGIRFPSRFHIEEAYINPEGKKFVRLENDVIYKNYKFFYVQVGNIEYHN